MDLIRRYAQAAPEDLALWAPSQNWTYAELDGAVAAARRQLRARGIERGTRVGLHLGRAPGTVILIWALWRCGAIVVPVSTRLPSVQVGARLRQVGGQCLIAAERDFARYDAHDLTVLSSDRLVEGDDRPPDPDELAQRQLPMDRSATIVFTSGSTGRPKAALHSWANHLYSAKGSRANLPLRQGDRWLLSLPLYHVGGLSILVRCALAGATVAIPEADVALGKMLRRAEATHVSLVATQFRRVLDEVRDGPPDDVRAVLLGGGPIPDSLLREGYELGWPLCTSYGCTEMASQVTTTAPGAPPDELRTAGRRLPHRRVRLESDQIQVSGRTLFQGYVTANGLEDPRTEHGWYPTGDRGRMDAAGCLHVLGRTDRMFTSGGENIQPEEIEAALERLDGVERAVVVPRPDDEYGQRPVAFLRTSTEVSEPEVRRALAGQLPRFKIPDAFHSLPDETTAERLKIDREWLREEARNLHHDSTPGEDSF